MIERVKKLFRQPETWSLGATVLRNTSHLFILPVVLRTVPSEQLGLWYVLVALGGFAALADLGFSQTIGRAATALAGGEGYLSASGPARPGAAGALLVRLPAFVSAARRLYRFIGLGTGTLVLLLAYFSYFDPQHQAVHDTQTRAAFFVFLLFTAYGAYSRWLSVVLTGLDEVAYVARQTVYGTLAYLVVTSAALACGAGILALALGQAIQPLVTNLLLDRRLRLRVPREAPAPDQADRQARLLAVLWPNSWRIGTMMLGAFLINNANTLLAARFLSLEETASYGLTLQFVGLLSTVAYMFIQARTPELVRRRLEGDLVGVRALFGRQLLLASGIFLAGGLGLVLCGNLVLGALGSQTPVLPLGALAFLVAYRFLEFHHGAFGLLVVSENRVPFVVPSIVSGLLIVLLGWQLAPRLGLWGLLVSAAGVQAAFNNWWTVLLGLRGLDCGYRQLLAAGRAKLVSAIQST